jgi:hypothetical protein
VCLLDLPRSAKGVVGQRMFDGSSNLGRAAFARHSPRELTTMKTKTIGARISAEDRAWIENLGRAPNGAQATNTQTLTRLIHIAQRLEREQPALFQQLMQEEAVGLLLTR